MAFSEAGYNILVNVLRLSGRILLVLLLAACSPQRTVLIPAAPTSSPAPALPAASQPAPACAKIGESRVSPRDGMLQLCVPAGEFLMGSNDRDTQAQPDERPQHTISLDAFWIDQTEVTNAMYSACVQAKACHERTYSPYVWGVDSRTRKNYFTDPQFRDYPVILLDADEAQAYCRWAGRHLPSEAQWEKAARGTDGRTYPWGEGIDCRRANYSGCARDTSAVSAHPDGASPYGALDQAGNLWEWTADWYEPGYYAQSPARNPTGPAQGKYRTLRGGSWGEFAPSLRAANRASGAPQHSMDGAVGFRCAE
ncbi:MAG TPA: SUMF1/EgtB/PvdO family nonheme iron enzyme [Anaerolineaceae bacterium]|nr:SUMF1/EgtB/PvdO family nonheme iron enzyme [Anaerolineaceae bacterium]